jgi:predicted MFS family arabinose efflux permease
VATLLMAGGVIGIVFQPLLGRMVDKLGEKRILMIEGFTLIFVCLGYGYAKNIFAGDSAFYLACVCYILDNMLISFGIARSTYLKRIADKPDHVASSLSMSVSMDHVFSISVALLGGTLWTFFGFQAVFLCGAVIALVYMISAAGVRLPERAQVHSVQSNNA